MTEEDYQELLERIKELRLALLFEEPCPLYEEFEDGVE
jgi:hypothetical protein|tara:strand:+ start:1903 stop:2016 length:114 start_codon:yes stop_codon:yes gene_type:complete